MSVSNFRKIKAKSECECNNRTKSCLKQNKV